MEINIRELTKIAIKACEVAGEKILQVYNSEFFDVEFKNDNSPLTIADKVGHEAIHEFLTKTGLPILSEEGKEISFNERRNWEYFWLVDPLDGTKEFIKKNGEFTVNIALIRKNEPIIGVVYAPVLKELFWGNIEEGSWKLASGLGTLKIEKPKINKIEKIVASKSHLSEETSEFIEKFSDVEVISMGSSLKFMLIAENKAQLYPRFAPTMEWDTAAADCIVRCLGIPVNIWPDKKPLVYNKENLLNPWFLVGDPILRI